jgi:hypothetical protein
MSNPVTSSAHCRTGLIVAVAGEEAAFVGGARPTKATVSATKPEKTLNPMIAAPSRAARTIRIECHSGTAQDVALRVFEPQPSASAAGNLPVRPALFRRWFPVPRSVPGPHMLSETR